MDLQFVDGDLLDQPVEVIVNAWNRNFIPWWLLLPQGVSRAIKRRGGSGPFREVAKAGVIPLGGAVVTGAGGTTLPCDHPRCRHQRPVAFVRVVRAGICPQHDRASRP